VIYCELFDQIFLILPFIKYKQAFQLSQTKPAGAYSGSINQQSKTTGVKIMSLAEWGLLFGVLANSVGLLIAMVKIVAWISSHIATVNERLNTLENQVNNDITGRKVVGEMRQDIAVIKTQITDIRDDLKAMRTPIN